MTRHMLRAKIHRATVTQADLNYQGSISLCPDLIRAGHFVEFERVDIYNCNNGERFSTYVIPGQPGQVCLNGAAARLVQPGDQVIICAYANVPEDLVSRHKPALVFVDRQNKILEIGAQFLHGTGTETDLNSKLNIPDLI
ncbi:MAG: aspartate 1-decarboxylase [Oligoflexia bacterium]|nr:aspartate 1-decarboxylase [Oligoflexia bacterium]